MITREALYEMVWADPMTVVAKKFNVSGSYLARICTRLNVPRPERGYWAKLAVGKSMPQPRLPAALAGDEISWDPGGGLATISRENKLIHDNIRTSEKNSRQDSITNSGHDILKGVKPLFLNGRLSQINKYLKPSKRLLPDIQVSESTLDLALEFANALFVALERSGHRVTLAAIGEVIVRPQIDVREKPTKVPYYIDLWSPARNTVLYVNGTPIGLTLFEMTESTTMRYINGKYVKEKEHTPPKFSRTNINSWTSIQEIPSGRLGLQAYTSYYDAEWSQQWKEAHVGDFQKKIPDLVRELVACSDEAERTRSKGKENAVAADLRFKAMSEKLTKEQDESRRAKAFVESLSELNAIIEKSMQHDRLEQLLLKITDAANSLNDMEIKKLQVLMSEARELLGSETALESFMKWRPPSDRL